MTPAGLRHVVCSISPLFFFPEALELQQQMKSPDKTLNESHVASTAADRSSTVTTGATSSDDIHDKKDK